MACRCQEFCGIARYCSRSCQSLHWRMGHTRECVPTHQWLMEAIANHAVVNADDGANAAAMPAVNNNSATHHNNLGGAAADAPAPK
ncbi:F-box protein [Zea mays]|uniref:F-box protein n=1 Tax=Zea mays TaxID=4577 RepID=A0A1D6H8A6_MAIZE|nr:F-box protein [Zea mays]